MQPKSTANRNSFRTSQVFMDNFIASFVNQQENECSEKSKFQFPQKQKKNVDVSNGEEWLEEEALKRDHPLANRLRDKVQSLLRNNRDFAVSDCSELVQRIAEEVVRVSLNEPGGLAACRIRVDLVICDNYVTSESKINKERPTTNLGIFDVSGNEVVDTFEIQLYLFSTAPALSWLRSVVTSLLRKRTGRMRNITLLSDFVLVKRKLFRSSSSNSIAVIKSIAA